MKKPSKPAVIPPKEFRVIVQVYSNDQQKWFQSSVGSADTEAEARKLITADLEATKQTYSGLIEAAKGARHYTIYRIGRIDHVAEYGF